MRALVRLVPLLALIVALPAAAQESRQAAAATAAKEKKVRALLEVTGASKLGQQVMDAMTAQFAQIPELPEGFIQEFKRLARPADLIDLIVPIYTKHLAEEDLDALIAFYKTPTGQRFIAKQPVITQESMEAGQRWGESLARRVLDSLDRK